MSPDADDDGDADGEDVCSRGEGVRDCDEPGCGDGVPLVLKNIREKYINK